MSNKAKKCLMCGHVNDEFEMYCVNCRASLENVKAVAANQTSASPFTTIAEKTSPGAGNSAKAAPTVRLPVDTIHPLPEYAELNCVDDNGFTFQIASRAVVGRETDVNVSCLPRSEIISRQHAGFYFENQRWYIEDLGSANGTFINGQKLSPRQKQEIFDGTKITLANTTFIFKPVK